MGGAGAWIFRFWGLKMESKRALTSLWPSGKYLRCNIRKARFDLQIFLLFCAFSYSTKGVFFSSLELKYHCLFYSTLLHIISVFKIRAFKTLLSLHHASKCLVQIQSSNLWKGIDCKKSYQPFISQPTLFICILSIPTFYYSPYKLANRKQPEYVFKILLHRLSWKSSKNGT